ncbi:ADP-ribosylglycohydrolase family protein [Alicyclobacillus sp. SO9]|nr:ADP-ribosylglycohydrolase family protein [Alicyclobacillus sp. SO9]
MERDFFDEEEFALDRIKGAILGHAIGDAMGATTEFMEPNEICRKYGTVTDILGGGWLHLKPGETTDDTAMSLCVAEGILESPDNPIDAIGQAFLRWEATDPEDIGNTIRSSLDHFNGDWLEAAYQTHLEFDGYTGGNGSLMRCLPVALAYTDSDKMEDITERQSKMTHYDDIASEACLIYNRIAARVLNGDNLLLALVAETDGTRYHNVFLDRPSCSPDGFVVNTFTWVLYLLWTYDSFAEVVQQATNEGYDSDTVAAIAGGLKGLSTQSFGLPQEWVNKLRNRKQLEKAAEDLYQLRQSMLGMTSQPAGTND